MENQQPVLLPDDNRDARGYTSSVDFCNYTPSYDYPKDSYLIDTKFLHVSGNLLVIGAPSANKSSFMLDMLDAMSFGEPFFDMKPSRSLRCYFLHRNIRNHGFDQRKVAPDEDIFCTVSGNLHLCSVAKTLDEDTVLKVTGDINRCYPDEDKKVDIIAIDALDVLFDGSGYGKNMKDEMAMNFFLSQRIAPLRYGTNPNAAIVLIHDVYNIDQQKLMQDPFTAFKGPPSLLSWFTTGLVLHKPDLNDSSLRLCKVLRSSPRRRKYAISLKR